MAVMLPSYVSGATVSDAERYVFGKLKEELSDNDWIAIHSLGLAGHRRKPWAEIDFVLVGPPGVFCLEVKGGSIARIGRVWTTTTRTGRTEELKESPFAQVGSAAAALHAFLSEKIARYAGVTGYGVVFPDVVFRVVGPDIESAIVCDAHLRQASIAGYVKELEAYWHVRCERDLKRIPSLLNADDRRRIRDVLAKDFDLCISLRAEIGAVSHQLVRLTEEQCRVIAGLTDNERVLTSGGAGTGKTLLAVSEARRLSSQGLRVLLVCFNRQLAAHVQGLLAGQSGICVHHLHGFMAKVVHEAGLEHRLPDAQSNDLFEVFYPELCVEALLERQAAVFDAMIVDEAQDVLLDSYVDVLDASCKGGLRTGCWRAFLDPYQNIYEGVSVKGLARLNATNPTRFRLGVNCRNTAAVATTTGLLSGIHSEVTLIAEGPPVEQFWYNSVEEQRRLVSDSVRKLLYNGMKPEEIVVLSRYKLSNSCLANGLISSTVPLRDFSRRKPEGTNAVVFSTIASFKGLEANAVLLVDVDDLADRNSLLSVYVGASRARVFLKVFLCETQRAAYASQAYAFGAAASSGCEARNPSR